MQPEANKKHSRVNKKLKKKKNHRLEGKYFYSCTFIAWGNYYSIAGFRRRGGVGGWKDSRVIREMDCSSHCFSLLWVLKSPMITTKCGHLFRLIDKGP